MSPRYVTAWVGNPTKVCAKIPKRSNPIVVKTKGISVKYVIAKAEAMIKK